MKSKTIKKNIEALIYIRAIGLFFFNWKPEAMEELCEKSKHFKKIWDELHAESKAQHEKDGGMWIVDHTDIYNAFSNKMSYVTQALVIEKAMEIHGAEAKHDIEFSLEIAELEDKIKAE